MSQNEPLSPARSRQLPSPVPFRWLVGLRARYLPRQIAALLLPYSCEKKPERIGDKDNNFLNNFVSVFLDVCNT